MWIPALAFHPTLPQLATAGSPPDTPDEERCREIHIYELDYDVLLESDSGTKSATKATVAARVGHEKTVHSTTAKIVLVGDSGVGKTGIGWRMANTASMIPHTDSSSGCWCSINSPPRRLEAEPIRDSILAVTGVLDDRMFGPGFSGFEVELENVRHYFPKKKYGPEDWRRMIYMTKVRLEKESVFGVFDCPDAATSVPKRSRSTTPLQALNLFNSPFMLQQAQLFADRLQRDCGDDQSQQIERAFWLCCGRAPDAVESRESLNFITEQDIAAFCRAMLNSNEFVFIE